MPDGALHAAADAEKTDYQVATRQVTIKDGVPPPRQDLKLVRLRW